MKSTKSLIISFTCVALLLAGSLVMAFENTTHKSVFSNNYIVKTIDVETRIPLEEIIVEKLNIENFDDLIIHPSKVIAGTAAKPYQFPYQVAMFIFGEGGRTFFCGGSLISRRYVLTAAHCLFEKPKQVLIVLGTENLDRPNHNEVRRNAAKYILHEKFDRRTLRNDICLLELDKPVKFNKAIRPIALPNIGEIHRNYMGSLALLSGYGKTKNGGELSKTLMYLQLKVMDLDNCDEYFGDGVVTSKNICTTGIGNRGACQGDSGGPLVIDNKLVGIVSFGGAHCSLGAPTVYTRVNAHIDWVNSFIDIVF